MTSQQTGLREALQRFLDFSPGPHVGGISTEGGSNKSGVTEASGAGHKNAGIRVFFAPGRVNLIGEHTDYNGGYVLPAALEMGTWVIVRVRADKRLRVASTAFPQVVEIPAMNDLHYSVDDDYANYPKGVIHEFQRLGFDIPGLDLLYYGNLPSGAGLSSSASIEVVTGFMLRELLDVELTTEQIALLAQRAENQFVGVNCGVMDQFAVALGQADHALSLNCDTLAYHLVPMEIGDITLVIANTNKRRGLSESKYNERRRECEAALEHIQRVRPGTHYLTDIDGSDWSAFELYLTDDVHRRRARHVVLENERAKQSVDVLARGDIYHFGQMMKDSHLSLRDDYEVTGPELDALAEAAWTAPGCIGARMTGAGFGGCTVNLIESHKVDEFVSIVREKFVGEIGYEPSFYITRIGDGAREVTNEVAGLLERTTGEMGGKAK